MSWHVKMVIQMVGLDPEDADGWLIALAEDCLERCYYLDRAAEALLRELWPRRY